METPHKPAQRRMSTSMLSPPESPKVYSERQNENLITSLQQENRRLTDRIHGLMIDHADYKRLIKDQEKQIAEYKSYCSAQSAQECITLKKENSNLKTELATVRARLVEFEESDVQEEVKRLKRALRSAHYTLDMLKVEKENVNPKLQKARYSDVPTAQPSALGKRKALDLSPVKTSQTAPSSPSSSTSSSTSSTSSSSSSTSSSSSSASSSASSTSSTTSASSVDSSSTSAVIPSCSRAKSEEADPNDANSRGKKRGRDEGESPDATGFSDFESDSDIALSPPPAVIAKTEGGVTLNALEQISVIGAQVSNLESLLQQQQLRAETERRRNFDLRKEHEDLRKKNATTSSELEAKMNEVHDLQKEVQKVQNSLPKKSSIQDAVEAVSRIEEAAKTQLVEAIKRHEQRLVEMTQRLHGLDQKRQQNISLLQSRLQSKAQEFHQTETQLRTQLNEKEEAMNRLQGELQRQEVESKELVQQQIASSSKADAFAQQLREHETRIEKLLAEGVQLQAKFQEQEVQVQGVRQEKDATISALQVQEVSLSKQLETALRTNESLDQRLQKAVEELGSKEEANEEFARQVNSARAANEELTKELNENRTTNLGLQSQLETSRTAYEELVGKVSQASKMNEELLQQIQSAQTSATQERTANEDLSKQTDKLAKERVALSEEVARLGQVIQSRDSDLEAVTAKNQELVLNVATLSERSIVLEQERSSLQTLLQELNGKLASVESQAGQLRKETEIEHQKLAEQHRHVQQELIQTQEQLSSSQAKLEETVKQLDTLVQQRSEMQATLAQDQRELTSLREKVSQLASTASAVVEAKTHELQRHAQFFQDHSHHALPVPEAIAAAQESSGAEEDTERTPPTPVLEHDALKPRTQPSTSPSQPRRSTRRRLSMAADENETPASSPAQVRVLFTGWKDRAGVPDYAYSIATKNQLAQIVSELGGIVPPDQEKLDKKFTHMCVPPDCRTAKSLGAALMGKYVVPPQWLIDSKTHGRFQPESAYGASTQQQLKGKVFYVSDSFKARWGSREEKMVHVALKLIVTCGSGIDWSVAKDPSVACDFTLVGDEREVVPKANEPMPRVLGKLLTWDSFLDSVVVSSSVPSVPSADIVVGPSPTKDGLTVSPSETSRKRTLDSAPTPTKNPSPAKRRQAPSSPTTAPVNRRRHVPSPSSPPQRTSRSRDTD